jgi:hypothetical protein
MVPNGIIHVTTLGGMQGRFRFRLIIDAFHNVNFSIDGPVGFICQPKGGPHATTGRHVSDINDKQATIEATFAFQTNGFPRTGFGGRRLQIQKGFRLLWLLLCCGILILTTIIAA